MNISIKHIKGSFKQFNTEYIKLFLCCGVLGSVLLIRDYFLLNIPWPIILALYLIPACTLSYYNLITFFWFSLPMITGLPANYIFVTTVALLVIKGPRRLGSYKVIPIVVIALYEFINLCFSKKPDIVESIGAISAISIFFLLIRYDKEDSKYFDHILAFAIGITITEIIMILSTLRDTEFSYLIYQIQRGYGRLGYMIRNVGGRLYCRLNPNALAYFCGTAFFALAFLLKRKHKFKVILILLMAMQLITGLLTLSRTWLLVMAVSVLFWMLVSEKSAKSIFNVTVLAAAGILLIAVFLHNNPMFLAGIQSRFQDGTVLSGNGRLDTFAKYWDAWLSDVKLFLLGSGAANYMEGYSHLVAAIHNGTLQIFLCYGLFGGVFFCVFLVEPIFRVYSKDLKVYYTTLIFAAVFLQTIQFINPYSQLYPYIIGLYSVYFEKSRKLTIAEE